jgi:hypothetical protein
MNKLRMRTLALLAVPIVAVTTVVLPAGPASAHIPLCVETVNPHGQTIPPAGTTLPGPKGGQNPDGFYQISSNVGTEVFVVDLGSGTVFGPYPSGTDVKYTQAPGSTPSAKKIGNDNGEAGAVLVHITGTGDMGVQSIDGNTVACLVPPPPK